MTDAEALERALLEQAKAVLPKGFAIVPKEPTPEMLEVAIAVWAGSVPDFDDDDWRMPYVRDFRAMVAAGQQ